MRVAEHTLHKAEAPEGGEVDFDGWLAALDEEPDCFGDLPADTVIAEDGIAEAEDQCFGRHGGYDLEIRASNTKDTTDTKERTTTDEHR
jgi:hypothetical protein